MLSGLIHLQILITGRYVMCALFAMLITGSQEHKSPPLPFTIMCHGQGYQAAGTCR